MNRNRYLPPRVFYLVGLLALAASYRLVETGSPAMAALLMGPALFLLGFTVIRRAHILDPEWERRRPQSEDLSRQGAFKPISDASEARALSSGLCIGLSMPLFFAGLFFYLVLGDANGHDGGGGGGLAGLTVVFGELTAALGVIAMIGSGVLLSIGLVKLRR